MSLIGIDLNASRARAVGGPRAQAVTLLPLEDGSPDLPVAVSLEGRQPVVGRAATGLRRRMPHLACLDFLPHLGTSRTWAAGRHKFDADRALGLVFEALRQPLSGGNGVFLSLPAYLREAQMTSACRIAEQGRCRVLGGAPAPLLAVLSAQESGAIRSAPGLALVVDVDGHALTWSAVSLRGGEARLLHAQPSASLSREAWLVRLLDGVSNRCVRLSRHDPRQSAEAEQSLYDQLARALEQAPGTAGAGWSLHEFNIRSGTWSQHLLIHPDEFLALAASLVRQAVAEMDAFRAAVVSCGQGDVSALLLTPAAGRLPGLAQALQTHLHGTVIGHAKTAYHDGNTALADHNTPEEFDLDEALLDEQTQATVAVPAFVLGPDSIARAAHSLALRVHAGELAPGLLEALPALCAEPQTAPAEDIEPGLNIGPPRLNFRGRDHVLDCPTFTLGRDPTCDLVFESELYPSVSARHCEIVFDRRTYTLCDRSRHGTLLNDRPVRHQAALHAGDWIRLGPSGPMLRFLGQVVERRTVLPR